MKLLKGTGGEMGMERDEVGEIGGRRILKDLFLNFCRLREAGEEKVWGEDLENSGGSGRTTTRRHHKDFGLKGGERGGFWDRRPPDIRVNEQDKEGEGGGRGVEFGDGL